MALHAVIALLIFDPKVSIGGDDSWYVLAAQDLIDGVAFPTWHGALYPILLAPIVRLFGIWIPALKLLSIALTLGSIWFLGASLRGRVHPTAWFGGLAVYAGCCQMASLSGTTYSEPLFVLLQSLLLLAVVGIPGREVRPWSPREALRLLLLGLLLFLLSQVRNVGHGALVAVLLHLTATRRDWARAGGTLAATLLFAVPFGLYRRLAWAQSQVSFRGQLDRILQVDFYNASAGQEDLWGMATRVALNAKQYLSYYLMEFLGLRLEAASWTVMLLVLGLSVWLFFRRPRPSDTARFLFWYLLVMLGITFVTQQVSWSQWRLVIVYLPLILIYLFDRLLAGGREALLPRVSRYGIPVLVGLSLLSNLVQAGRRVDPLQLSANLRGDTYRGLTPDWESYLRMSEWVGRHIPDSVVVACRKPNNSRIYGNRRFFGIFKVPSWHPDTVRMFLDSNRVEYVIAGRLRNDITRRTEEFINTVHYTLAVALQSDPALLEHVRTEGYQEPTLLFRLHRGDRGTDLAYRARLEAGLMIFADNAGAHHELARLSLSAKRPDEALEHSRQALELLERAGEEPPYPLLEIRAMAYYMQGDYQTAARIFERLTGAHPAEGDLWHNLGICYERLKDPRAAMCFGRAAQLRGPAR